jgi:hypothetical protein
LRPLRFLTDEHISPAVARELRRKRPGLFIVCMQEWQEGAYLGSSDDVVLREATRQGLTFVSYDQRTIRPLLKTWDEAGMDHAGFVFIDEKTIAPQNLGELVKGLGRIWESERGAEWANRVVYLVATG